MARPDAAKPVLVIDGSRFTDFEGFAREFSSFLSDWTWNENLDAFNDILRGGFGTPASGFVLRWANSERSRQVLGWSETVSLLERTLARCHPTNRARVRSELDLARHPSRSTERAPRRWVVPMRSADVRCDSARGGWRRPRPLDTLAPVAVAR